MNITITQLGGHSTSYAGDCAIIKIKSEVGSSVVVIDTGASAALSQGTFEALVGAANDDVKGKLVLIATHQHADHFDMDKVGVVTKLKGSWYHGDNYANEDWGKGGAYACNSGGEAGPKTPRILTAKDSDGWVCAVDCWAPAWTAKDWPKSKDENHFSLATAVYVWNSATKDANEVFCFYTLGDITQEGYTRLPPLPLAADVAKFPHHGSDGNRISYFQSADVVNYLATVLISGDSGTAASTVGWLYKVQPILAMRAAFRTSASQADFESKWATWHNVQGKGAQVDLEAGTDAVVNWSSDKTDTVNVGLTDARSYKLRATGKTSRSVNKWLWGAS